MHVTMESRVATTIGTYKYHGDPSWQNIPLGKISLFMRFLFVVTTLMFAGDVAAQLEFRDSTQRNPVILERRAANSTHSEPTKVQIVRRHTSIRSPLPENV